MPVEILLTIFRVCIFFETKPLYEFPCKKIKTLLVLNVSFFRFPLNTAQKRNLPLRISSITVTNSAGNCGFGHIH